MKLNLPIGAKIFISIFLVAIVLEVWTVNRLSTYGSKINQLKTSQAAIVLENQILENQIAANASLMGAENSVRALGFRDIKDPIYIQPQTIASAF